MWIATRPFRYRGVSYQVGDTVPAERWPNRKALEVTRRIKQSTPGEPFLVSDPVVPSTPLIPPTSLKGMRRSELNEYAASIGLADPSSYANAELLIKAIEEHIEAHTSTEDEGESTAPVDGQTTEGEEDAEESEDGEESEDEESDDGEDQGV